MKLTITLQSLHWQLTTLSVLPAVPSLRLLAHDERVEVMDTLNRRDQQLARYRTEREEVLTRTLALLRAAHPQVTDAQARRIDAVLRQEIKRINPDDLGLLGFDGLHDWYEDTAATLNAAPATGPALSATEVEALKDRLYQTHVKHAYEHEDSPEEPLNMTAGERAALLEKMQEYDQSLETLACEVRTALTLLSGTLKQPGVSDEEHAALLAALGALPVTDRFSTAFSITLALVRRYEDLTGVTDGRLISALSPDNLYGRWRARDFEAEIADFELEATDFELE